MGKEHLEILLEDLQSKLELVLEGNEAFRSEIRQEIHQFREESNEKYDTTRMLIKALSPDLAALQQDTAGLRNDLSAFRKDVTKELAEHGTEIKTLSKKIKTLSKKIDHVAADLAENRADTERHRGYKVCES
jgi:gas vesicle protein